MRIYIYNMYIVIYIYDAVPLDFVWKPCNVGNNRATQVGAAPEPPSLQRQKTLRTKVLENFGAEG